LSCQFVARVRQIGKLSEPSYQLDDDGQRHVGTRVRVVGEPMEHRYGHVRDADGGQEDGGHEVYAVRSAHAARHQPRDPPVSAGQPRDDVPLAAVFVVVGGGGVEAAVIRG